MCQEGFLSQQHLSCIDRDPRVRATPADHIAFEERKMWKQLTEGVAFISHNLDGFSPAFCVLVKPLRAPRTSWRNRMPLKGLHVLQSTLTWHH